MSQKNKKTLVIAVVALAVLLVAWLGVSTMTRHMKEKQENEAADQAATLAILSLPENDIAAISYPGDDGEIHLEQKNGQWTNAEDGHVLTGSRMKLLTDDLAALTAERVIEDVTDLTTYGLADSARTINITMQDGTQYALVCGDKNTTTNELYVQLASDKTKVYLTKTALDSHFSGRVQALAAYDTFPYIEPSTMREFDV